MQDGEENINIRKFMKHLVMLSNAQFVSRRMRRITGKNDAIQIFDIALLERFNRIHAREPFTIKRNTDLCHFVSFRVKHGQNGTRGHQRDIMLARTSTK